MQSTAPSPSSAQPPVFSSGTLNRNRFDDSDDDDEGWVPAQLSSHCYEENDVRMDGDICELDIGAMDMSELAAKLPTEPNYIW